jgi:hypothetical protein
MPGAIPHELSGLFTEHPPVTRQTKSGGGVPKKFRSNFGAVNINDTKVKL